MTEHEEQLTRTLIKEITDLRKEIVDLFENANYVIANETATSITFRLRNPFLRLMRLYEDSIVIDFSESPIMMEGFRKDILRFSRGIEYICRKDEE